MKVSENNSTIGIMFVPNQGDKIFGIQTYYYEDIVKYSDIDERRLFFFSPTEWELGSEGGIGYQFVDGVWTKVKGSIPDVIYDRASSKVEEQKKIIEAFRSFLKVSNKTILNPFALAELLNDKVKFHKFLESHQIPTLGTYSIEVLKDHGWLDTCRFSKVYVKPVFGSKGDGIYVIEKKESGFAQYDKMGYEKSFDSYADLLIHLESKIDNEDMYFVQEAAMIQSYEGAPFDIRVLVQNYGDSYEVTGKAVRIGQKKSMTSNLNSGGSALPVEEMAEFFVEQYSYSVEDLQCDIDQLCLTCTDLLRNKIGEFCEIGFDILVTKDKGPIIIEANAKPTRWVFVKMADYLEGIGKDNSYYWDRRRETVRVPMKYAMYLME